MATDGTATIDGARAGRATCLLCPNPGPMTLDGTNTWVLREPGASEAVVVDPGPNDPGHLRRVADVATDGGARVVVTLLSHGHDDHSGGAAAFAELTGAPVRAVDPRHRVAAGGTPATGLADGDVIRAGELEIEVIATPGHTPDSVCFHLPADGVILTGDTVLGRGTTMITDDGLGDYLVSLERLRAVVRTAGMRALLPAHGPVRTDPEGTLTEYLAHRQQRLDQITAAVSAGDRTVAEIAARVYPGIEPGLLPAAGESIRAGLRYLAARGTVPAELVEG